MLGKVYQYRFTELAPQQMRPQVSLWWSETTFLSLAAGPGTSGNRPELGSQSNICDIQHHHHCGATFLGFIDIDFSHCYIHSVRNSSRNLVTKDVTINKIWMAKMHWNEFLVQCSGQQGEEIRQRKNDNLLGKIEASELNECWNKPLMIYDH